MRVNASACVGCGRNLGSGNGPHQGHRQKVKGSWGAVAIAFADGNGVAIKRKEINLSSSILPCFSGMGGSLGCGEAKKVNIVPKKCSTEVA
jgi:hypothetical protein